MAKCCYCGAETGLYYCGEPICLKCDEPVDAIQGSSRSEHIAPLHPGESRGGALLEFPLKRARLLIFPTTHS